ncbi:unnamed protein product, partial [Mycena citricolor]
RSRSLTMSSAQKKKFRPGPGPNNTDNTPGRLRSAFICSQTSHNRCIDDVRDQSVEEGSCERRIQKAFQEGPTSTAETFEATPDSAPMAILKDMLLSDYRHLYQHKKARRQCTLKETDRTLYDQIESLCIDRIEFVESLISAGPRTAQPARPAQPEPLRLPSPVLEENDGAPGNTRSFSPADCRDVLKNSFGLAKFLPEQLEVILEAFTAHDFLVVFPTGAGKSLSFQLPAVLMNEKFNMITVVVSPLIAIIQDQEMALREKGIKVMSFCSGDGGGHVRPHFNQNIKPALLYVTPERIQKSPTFMDELRTLHRSKHLARFIVDEAHCVAPVDDFRDAYAELGACLRKNFPDIPISAFTATASPTAAQLITKSLNMVNPRVFRRSTARPNLRYSAVPTRSDECFETIAELITERGLEDDTGIVYCFRRDRCEALALFLRKKGVSAKHYHAEMTDQEKAAVYKTWKHGICKVIVATVAFGMGVNHSDVRFVLHCDPPRSLDNYLQESGRAGRDGQPAECVIFYNPRVLRRELAEIPGRDSRAVKALRQVANYCDESLVCRSCQLLAHCGESTAAGKLCGACDNCVSPKRAYDLTADIQQFVSLLECIQKKSGNPITALQTIDVFIGRNTKWIRVRGYDQVKGYAAGRHIGLELAKIMITRLIFWGILGEYRILRHDIGAHYYLRIERDLAEFKGGRRLQIGFADNREDSTVETGRGKSKSKGVDRRRQRSLSTLTDQAFLNADYVPSSDSESED